MQKKNIRQRREYLYTMENENKLKKRFKDKEAIIKASNQNKSIPTELYK